MTLSAAARSPRVLIVGALGLAAVVVLGLLPWYVTDSYWVTVAADVCIFAILGLSYNLLLGQIGLFSFGHALFFGASAYILGNLTTGGMGLLPGAILAVGGNIGLAIIIGLLTIRVSGIYFAIVTLAFAQAAYTAAERDVLGLTGGENGKPIDGLPRELNINVFPENLYWLAFAMLVLSVLVVWGIRRSMMGRVWDGIRESPLRAQSLGIAIPSQRIVAFAVAGGLAGVAGVLNAMSLQYATPNELALDITVQALLITIIGGPGTLLGPLLGAVFVRVSAPLIDQWGRTDFVQGLSEVPQRALTSHALMLGIVYIALVLFLPGGLASLGERFRRTRNTLRGDDDEHGDRLTGGGRMPPDPAPEPTTASTR
jgi:branched-chain amino acid transport system permease protein